MPKRDIRQILLSTLFLFTLYLSANPLAEQLKQTGYIEIDDPIHGKVGFDALYTRFDELTLFLQTNPLWANKLYMAKDRFIRSKAKDYYSTNFFGFYDESQRVGRNQISFYYSSHFHEFICSYYPEITQVPEINDFFEACLQIQQPYKAIVNEIATKLGLETLFASTEDLLPILLKVVKYLPSYIPKRPHYDGSAFSLLLDSTDNSSLLLSPYKSSYTVDDFFSPIRRLLRLGNQNSILVIPGSLLTEFSIYPTPHIVLQSGKTRYATIAFAMRPHHIPEKIPYSPLPDFRYK